MKKQLCVLLSALLLLSLAACGQNNAANDSSSDSDAPALSEGELLLQDYLLTLSAEDVVNWSWTGFCEPAQSEEELLAQLHEAAAHPISAAEAEGSAYGAIWSLDIYVGDANTDAYSTDNALHLYAGLRENVIKVLSGSNLPGSSIYLESEPLYTRLRTSMDYDFPLDEDAYARYQDAVDEYLSTLPEFPEGITARRELVGFYEANSNPFFDAQAYCIVDAITVDPPEKAPLLLAGGAYVDSQLRTLGSNSKNFLIVIDGEPYCMTYREGAHDLSGFETAQELKAYLDTLY